MSLLRREKHWKQFQTRTISNKDFSEIIFVVQLMRIIFFMSKIVYWKIIFISLRTLTKLLFIENVQFHFFSFILLRRSRCSHTYIRNEKLISRQEACTIENDMTFWKFSWQNIRESNNYFVQSYKPRIRQRKKENKHTKYPRSHPIAEKERSKQILRLIILNRIFAMEAKKNIVLCARPWKFHSSPQDQIFRIFFELFSCTLLSSF